jgi:proline iminopeptidase
MSRSRSIPHSAGRTGLTAALLSVWVSACTQSEQSTPTDLFQDSVLVDGALLHYTIEGSGHPCLVIGSQTFHQRVFSARFKSLLRCAYADTRMFSPGAKAPFGRPYDMSVLVQDVEAVRREIGMDSVVLVGHSLFAWVALEYARAYPERVAGVVMIAMSPMLPFASMANFMDTDASPQRRAAHERQQREWEEWSRRGGPPEDEVFQYSIVNSAIYWYDPEYDSGALWEGVKWDAGLFDEVVASTESYDIAAGPPVAQPVFVGIGRYDYVAPYTLWDDRSKSVFERLTFHLFQESGHQPPFEEPDAFDSELARWLDREFD